MDDLISRKFLIEAFKEEFYAMYSDDFNYMIKWFENLPAAQPERLTDDDFEAIRIHLNACKEKLCNQQRWEEAEEYQRIIDRFMAYVSAQPETHDKRTEARVIKLTEADKESLRKAMENADLTLVAEPRKGKWIVQITGWGDMYYECSYCKGAITLIDGTPEDNFYCYCPHCGARMEES